MLERAAACLTHGKQSWRRSSEVLKSRRMHSAFWRHGACDLDLPAWSFATLRALFEPDGVQPHGSTRRDGTGNRATPHPEPLLDFLYPAQTRAFMERLSGREVQRWYQLWRRKVALGRHIHVSTRSNYQHATARPTTTAAPPPPPPPDATFNNTASPGAVDELSSINAAEIHLKTILASIFGSNPRTPTSEDLDQAWELFRQLESGGVSQENLIDLIRLFSERSDQRQEYAGRLLRVWKSCSQHSVPPNIHSRVIAAYIAKRDFRAATALYSSALKALPATKHLKVSRVLPGVLFQNHRWKDLLRAWTSCLEHESKSSPGTVKHGGQGHAAFVGDLVNLPDCFEHFERLLAYLKNVPRELESNRDSIAVLLDHLLPVLFTSTAKPLSFVTSTLQQLEQLKMANAASYEAAYSTAPSHAQTGDTPSSLTLYHQFRRSCSIQPRLKTIHILFRQALELNDEVAIAMLLDDRSCYEERMPVSITGQLMKHFSHRPNREKVEGLFYDHLRKDGTATLPMLYSLLHVYAVTRTVQMVELEMSEMQAKYNLTPDITCWNILLNAYAKVDDLDGCLSCMSKLMESKIEPDHYTFGTAMALCAERGDVDLLEQLLRTADFYGISKTAAMIETHVLAYLNNEDVESAEVIAEEATINPSETFLTRAWTQIVGFHAVRKDLDAVIRTIKRMRELNIALDSVTYAAMLRVFVARGKSTLALRVLERVMLKNNIPIYAIHYAIIIDGLARESLFELGFRVHADMLRASMKPTPSTKLALLRLQTLAAKQKLVSDQAVVPGVRADVPEELLEEILTSSQLELGPPNTPELQSSARRSGFLPGPYLEILLDLYGRTQSYDIIRSLLLRYEREAAPQQDPRRISMSMHMLSSIMNMHYIQGSFGEVARYWRLALSSARLSAETAGPLPDGKLPFVRRTLLAGPLGVYMKALVAQDDFLTLDATIADMTRHGFALDNGNWASRVEALATRGRAAEAFAMCEQELMKTPLPSWQPKEPKVRRWQAAHRKDRGMEFMGPKYTARRPGQLTATYKTLVRLSLTFRRLKRDAPYDREARSALETIRKDAPQTVVAVLSLPVWQQHPVATHVLGSRTGWGGKRKILPME